MSRTSAPAPDQQPLPVQPVEKPILCRPYDEPSEHWVYTTEGDAIRMPGRRPASYWYKTQRVAEGQLSLLAEEQREDLPLVNALRADVKRWRASGYEGATQVTKELLRYWGRADRLRRLFFCQLEAAETVIFLNEIRLAGRQPRFTPQFTDDHLDRLRDLPADPSLLPLTRLGLKMATGSGKTVVMAMLLAWSFCNRGQVTSDARFPAAALIVCPNLTIKERLQVLRPENPVNYFAEFDLVPAAMRPFLHRGKVLVTNWHLFAPESEHVEGGKSYTVVNKGPESPAAFARRVLGDLTDRAPILVMNDEGHHAWRPRPAENGATTTPADPAKEVEAEIEEATVWINGLDTLNRAVGVRCCVDLSATPFYLGRDRLHRGRAVPLAGQRFRLGGRHRERHRQNPTPAGQRHHGSARAKVLPALAAYHRGFAAGRTAAWTGAQAQTGRGLSGGRAGPQYPGKPVGRALRVHSASHRREG